MSNTTARRVRVGRHKQSVATLSETIWDASDGTHMLVTVEEWERLQKRSELLESGWPILSDPLLGHIEGTIIERTGDGPLAAYVVQWLDKQQPWK